VEDRPAFDFAGILGLISFLEGPERIRDNNFSKEKPIPVSFD
jgi:hypothetical protein